MKEETLQRLDALAAKLGVAAGHLWEVLTRQGVVVGAQGLLWFLVVVITGAFVIPRLYKAVLKETEDKVAPLFACVLAGAFFAALAGAALDTASYLFNPEMYAVEAIKGMLR